MRPASTSAECRSLTYRRVGFAWNFYLENIKSFDRNTTFPSGKAKANNSGRPSCAVGGKQPWGRWTTVSFHDKATCAAKSAA